MKGKEISVSKVEFCKGNERGAEFVSLFSKGNFIEDRVKEFLLSEEEFNETVERIKKENEKIKNAEEKAKKEAEIAEEKVKKEAENIRIREEQKEKKAREKEDAKYTDEYLEDNLYPKTKYNKF